MVAEKINFNYSIQFLRGYIYIYIYKSEFPFSSFNFRHFLGNRREKRISKFNIFKLSYHQTQFSFERNVPGTFVWLLKNELQLFGSVFERFFCFLISLGNHSFRCSISFSFSVTKQKREYGRYLSSRHLEDSEPLDLCNLLWNSPFSQWDYETRNENEMEFKISNNRNKWGSKFLFISQMTHFFCFLFSSIPLLPCWTLNFATWKNKFPHWKGLKEKKNTVLLWSGFIVGTSKRDDYGARNLNFHLQLQTSFQAFFQTSTLRSPLRLGVMLSFLFSQSDFAI